MCSTSKVASAVARCVPLVFRERRSRDRAERRRRTVRSGRANHAVGKGDPVLAGLQQPGGDRTKRLP